MLTLWTLHGLSSKRTVSTTPPTAELAHPTGHENGSNRHPTLASEEPPSRHTTSHQTGQNVHQDYVQNKHVRSCFVDRPRSQLPIAFGERISDGWGYRSSPGAVPTVGTGDRKQNTSSTASSRHTTSHQTGQNVHQDYVQNKHVRSCFVDRPRSQLPISFGERISDGWDRGR